MDSFFAIYLCIVIPASFSLMGSMFILIVYLRYQSLHCFAFRLVAYLSLFNCFDSMSQILPAHMINDSACIVQAVGIQFFGMCGILWTGSICLIMYFQVVKHVKNIRKYERLLLLSTIALSTCTIVIPLFFNEMGYVGGNCWIENINEGAIFRWAFFFIPAWLVIILISITYFLIIRKVHEESHLISGLDEERRLIINKLRVYPIIMAFTFMPLTLYRIIQYFTTPLWFYSIAIAIYNLIGLFNALFYGFNESVKAELAKTIKSVGNDISMC